MQSGEHKPLLENAKTKHVKHVAAMFRAPKQRMASMYYYLQNDVKHGAGGKVKMQDGHPLFYGAGQAWGWNQEIALPVRQAIFENKSIASTVGKFGACQANMVLGARCMSRRDWGMPSHAIVDKAFERVTQFRFAGLEGSWDLSICLFNYLMTGVRYVSRGQLVDSRPTSGTGPSEYDETGVPDDPVDGPLYNKIAARFAAQLQEHNITSENCRDSTFWKGASLPTIRENTVVHIPLAVGPKHSSTDDPGGADAPRRSLAVHGAAEGSFGLGHRERFAMLAREHGHGHGR